MAEPERTEPRVELTNPDAPAPSIATHTHLMFGHDRRWTQVRVRRDGSAFYLDALAEDGRHDHRLTLSGNSLADLEAAVEDLARALAAFSVELAKAEAGGGPPSAPAGFGLTPEHRPAGPAPEHDPDHDTTGDHYHDPEATMTKVRAGRDPAYYVPLPDDLGIAWSDEGTWHDHQAGVHDPGHAPTDDHSHLVDGALIGGHGLCAPMPASGTYTEAGTGHHHQPEPQPRDREVGEP